MCVIVDYHKSFLDYEQGSTVRDVSWHPYQPEIVSTSVSLHTFHLLYPFFFFFWSFEVDNQRSFNGKISFLPWLFIQYITCRVRRGKCNFWSTLLWAKLCRYGFLSVHLPVGCGSLLDEGWGWTFGKNSVLYSLEGARLAWWLSITPPTYIIIAWGPSFSLSKPESRVFSS